MESEKMSQISIDVTEQQKQKKKELNLKWSNILAMGFKSGENAEKIYMLNSEVLQLQRELDDLKINYMIRGKKLTAYIEKFGIEEDIIYKKDYKNGVVENGNNL